MEIKVIGHVEKRQLFLLSDEVYEKFKSDEEIRKSISIPPFIKNNKKFEFKGESMKSFPDFIYEDKEGCKEILNILTCDWPMVFFDDIGGPAELELGEPNQEEEKKHTIEGNKYLLLERSCDCGNDDDSSVPGYIGLIETPEEYDEKMQENPELWHDLIAEKKKDFSIKLTKHRIDYREYKEYQIFYKNKNLDDFCFAYDRGCSAALFIADGKGGIVDDWHPDWRR